MASRHVGRGRNVGRGKKPGSPRPQQKLPVYRVVDRDDPNVTHYLEEALNAGYQIQHQMYNIVVLVKSP